ncbi:MAG: ribose-phosphate pyrophosphokinase [Firmicutes bacterium]|nr:ribose-phosphate pyrophosphokinase [Bacillota bacterium]
MSVIRDKKVKLFALSSNLPLAEKIAEAAQIPLSKAEVFKFADGEITVNIEESVRGHDVFIIQSTSAPANEHIMELLIMADAIKRASAKSLTVIMPYYGYSRQDRKSKSRQPITAKLIADLIEVSGIDRMISIDLHAAQIQGFFNIPIDNFPASSLLAETFINTYDTSNVVVVSPDHGGVTRARMVANVLGATLAIIDKRRPKPNVAEIQHIIGDVKGMKAIMIDDMIDTARTLCAGAQALIDAGASEVYAMATHPVFSGNSIELIENSVLKEVLVTDTIQVDLSKSTKIKQISIGKLLGRSIVHIAEDLPISQLFDRLAHRVRPEND